MATTLKGFIVNSQGAVITPANAATGFVQALPSVNCNQLVQPGYATRLDTLVDLSAASGGSAKNAAFYLNLAISTPVTLDATAIASAATASAGDNSLATIYSAEFTNLGGTDITFGAAASNPALLGMLGTTPKHVIPANGGKLLIKSAAGFTTASANNMKFDSGAAVGQLGVALGGA